jgi:aldose sugar dehydrogenase
MKKIIIIIAAIFALFIAGVVGFIVIRTSVPDPFVALFEENCSSCHGVNLEGTGLGPALVGTELKHGDSVAAIAASIATGFPERGMPPWRRSMDDGTVQSLAIFVSEQRANRPFEDFKVDQPLSLPTAVIVSQAHRFVVKVVATGLDPLPFSLAPLPDGSFLVTEKTKGIRIVSASGELSDYIEGTPEAFDDGIELGPLEFGLGWLLDIALHPDYANNGWVYLHYGDRCQDCPSDSFLPVTMNTVVRAQIQDGVWTDQEIIWQAPPETYTSMPDLGAGGRICFDDEGHVFLSVGIKGPSNFEGIQDLSLPYGKIHRVNDDGSIPTDNPFISTPGVMPSIWTYGHRSPQGLEYDPITKQLWGTEMGPRGGDEVNLLLPGHNFGWPLTSKGVDYDGSPVEYGKNLGIEFDLADIDQPIVDLTPSPAVSSFIFYDGEAFPNWHHNLIVGTLKATQLYRMVVQDNKVVHMETLLKDFARIRDIEKGYDGNIYLLLEHKSGGQIVSLIPADNYTALSNLKETL